MSDEKKPDPYYMARGKELVDILYDKRYLADDLSRATIEGLEGFIAHLFQFHADSAVRISELSWNRKERQKREAKDG